MHGRVFLHLNSHSKKSIEGLFPLDFWFEWASDPEIGDD